MIYYIFSVVDILSTCLLLSMTSCRLKLFFVSFLGQFIAGSTLPRTTIYYVFLVVDMFSSYLLMSMTSCLLELFFVPLLGSVLCTGDPMATTLLFIIFVFHVTLCLTSFYLNCFPTKEFNHNFLMTSVTRSSVLGPPTTPSSPLFCDVPPFPLGFLLPLISEAHVLPPPVPSPSAFPIVSSSPISTQCLSSSITAYLCLKHNYSLDTVPPCLVPTSPLSTL